MGSDITVEILTMKLSGGNEDYYVRIAMDGRNVDVSKYRSPYYNRALYERDHLRYVLLNTPKPNIMDSKYSDPEVNDGI